MEPSPRSFVRLEGATKHYGNIRALSGVTLGVQRGEFFTVLGPSGSGKTTLLHIIAGLVEPTQGRVLIDDVDVTGTAAHKRNLAVVFQSLALFPHMDVFGNVAFPLRMRRVAQSELSRRVGQALEMVRLTGIDRRPVRELSGGQRQRVALARALVYRPRLLLLDEPLGSLDRRLREEMQLEFVRLHRDIHVTIINVTHDQREALLLSDRIAVMDQGRIHQIGDPEELYTRPATPFVASFLGDATLIPGRLVSEAGSRWLLVGEQRLAVRASGRDGAGIAVLHCEAVRLLRDPACWPEADNVVPASVETAKFDERGMLYEAGVSIGACDIARVKIFASRMSGGGESRFSPGESAWLAWRAADVPILEGT